MSELENLLENQLDALIEIQDVLARERECLLASSGTQFAQVAIQKRRILDDLARSGRALQSALGQQEGVAADSSLLERYIARAEIAGELSSLRERIGEALHVCSELNRMNGAILECRRAASERALRVLLSQHRDADLYQASGRLRSAGAGQSIGSA
jgi:flagellar biosynthesis/type III secretory pathway chaperone